jgi:hypothetical protein
MRALADREPPKEFERPFLDFAWLLDGESPFGDAVCSIRFEIANLDDIALLGGPQAAREASETIARRLSTGIDGPHRPRQMCARRFFLSVPLPLEEAVELGRMVADAITRPIVFGRLCIQVAVGAHVVVGKRSDMSPALAVAA